MTVSEGTFQLYSSIEPPLEAGEWRVLADQEMTASGPSGNLDHDDLDVEQNRTHLRVRSPRYLLPPDQVLSTFPPANSFGSYGSRLPQVVIKRRTLPWERIVDGSSRSTPWLALVLIAEGEARLDTNVPVAKCVTSGVTLDGIADVETGNCLVVRKSVMEKVFPTQKDVPLLAHAREVDISDTELMMGDDDGFLAVVISNRLPVPGVDADGAEAPVKYLACLVNLEEQLKYLLPESPPPVLSTRLVRTLINTVTSAALDDHRVMGTTLPRPDAPMGPVVFDGTGQPLGGAPGPGPAPQALSEEATTAHTSRNATLAGEGTPTANRPSQWSGSLEDAPYVNVYTEMARDFRVLADVGPIVAADPEFRFPVLLHWSFTSSGSTTFRSLMEGLDSGLLGTTSGSEAAPTGRLPLEVAESGHVGLEQRTREGDQVRSWYRGPLLAHPTEFSDRLPLAHAADQLRIVIPDGREDLSLAAAFEIGRLLALSRPTVVAALMTWRQGHYQVGRRRAAVLADRPFWESLLGSGVDFESIADLGAAAGRRLASAIATDPGSFVGDPRPLVTPGRAIEVAGHPTDVLAAGLGYDPTVLRGDPAEVLNVLRDMPAPRAGSDVLGPIDLPTREVHDQLHRVLDDDLLGLVTDVLATGPTSDPLGGPTIPIRDTGPADGTRLFDTVLGPQHDHSEENDR